jgi:hypothetical protein
VGKDRVERIWRREGLKVLRRQKPRERLRLNDGSCVRPLPEHRDHVWSYDFVSASTHDGRGLRMLSFSLSLPSFASAPITNAERVTGIPINAIGTSSARSMTKR